MQLFILAQIGHELDGDRPLRHELAHGNVRYHTKDIRVLRYLSARPGAPSPPFNYSQGILVLLLPP